MPFLFETKNSVMEQENQDKNTLLTDEQVYTEEGQKIILNSLETKLSPTKLWAPYSQVYEDEETGAKVFTGSQSLAQDRDLLESLELYKVVNCTQDMPNYFSEDIAFSYLRFCISSWQFKLKPQPKKTREELLLSFVDIVLDQIDEWLDAGKNVLIHCLAGAHRAGTTTVLFLMRKHKLTSENAKLLAKKLRPIINPIFRLQALLTEVDKAIEKLNSDKKLKATSKWYRKIQS
eukprot:maker-scaffold_2-snap-gene-8.31-mRNA-1 protein AED:0.02 eAED:0.02 QI:263/1/1/1/0.25/0.2/5/217/232